MTLRSKFSKIAIELKKNTFTYLTDKETLQCEQITDDYAIEFANWLRMVDIPENAEKWFHYSDKDMLNVFKKERGL